MSEISCGICADLLPLVEDGVASEDSRRAVEQHLAHCAACRRLAGDLSPVPPPDDRKILSAVRRRLAFIALALVLGGALLGAGISGGSGMFYNILLMPCIGAVGLLAFGKKGWLVPPGVFAATLVWTAVRDALHSSLAVGLTGGVFFGMIYAVLCALGALAAALLRFALRKEEPT